MQIRYANNTKLQVHKDNPIKGVLVTAQFKSKPPHSAVMQNLKHRRNSATDVKVTDVNPTRIPSYVCYRKICIRNQLGPMFELLKRTTSKNLVSPGCVDHSGRVLSGGFQCLPK